MNVPLKAALVFLRLHLSFLRHLHLLVFFFSAAANVGHVVNETAGC